jgi:hypothetical protein
MALRAEFAPYADWLGRWEGEGQTLRNLPIKARVTIGKRLEGELLEIVVEVFSAETGELVHGVVALLTVDPDSRMRMNVSSTIHGAIVMPVTPDDPGVLAIEGTSVVGNRVVVSILHDERGMMLTAYWRPEGSLDADPVGFSNYRLRRASAP